MFVNIIADPRKSSLAKEKFPLLVGILDIGPIKIENQRTLVFPIAKKVLPKDISCYDLLEARHEEYDTIEFYRYYNDLYPSCYTTKNGIEDPRELCKLNKFYLTMRWRRFIKWLDTKEIDSEIARKKQHGPWYKPFEFVIAKHQFGYDVEWENGFIMRNEVLPFEITPPKLFQYNHKWPNNILNSLGMRY